MAEDFGPGVSRTLDAVKRAFRNLVWQKKKPPLDSELNLMGQVASEELRESIRAVMPSGFLLDPTAASKDFVFNPLDSNQFFLGQQVLDDAGDVEEWEPVLWANVNGWIVPVVGTAVSQVNSTTNRVTLNPPPDSDARIDLVFLEVWLAQVAPPDSEANKPSQTQLWPWGNVDFGGTPLTDDLRDPTIDFETTERIQIQYRIRVFGSGTAAGSSVSLDVYPDGLDDPNVTAQGTLTDPSTETYARFTNMREAMGDPGLWRAGDGDPANELGTVDGYVYAVPIAAVFRRNSSTFVAANLSGNPNQNGAFNRQPSSATLPDPRAGAKTLTQPTLASDMDAVDNTVDITIDVTNLAGSGLDDPSLTLASTFIVIEGEIMSISAVDTVSSPNTITIPAGGRGRFGSDISTHAAGTSTNISIFNTRPDGLFSDQIAECDVLDLRRAVNPGDWDYERILLHNIAELARGDLRTTWKQSGVPGGDTQGPCVVEVDYLLQDGATAVPNGTEALDGLDGIRTTFSDAATFQADVTVMCDEAPTLNQGFVAAFDGLVTWDAGADFKPSGFMNNQNGGDPGFKNGTVIFMHIGGDTGNLGARKTFRDGSLRKVRFVSPQEHWKTNFPNRDPETGLQHPWKLRWVGNDNGLPALTPAAFGETATEHPGPMYPLKDQDFERPFIVLGGLLASSLQIQNIPCNTGLFNTDPTNNIAEITLTGLDFDTAGIFYTLDSNGRFNLDVDGITQPLLRGERTLYDMLTAGGTDRTGSSSEVYLVLFGDDTNEANNGAFKVIGAGTAGYTTNDAGAADRVVVEFLTDRDQATGSFTVGGAGVTVGTILTIGGVTLTAVAGAPAVDEFTATGVQATDVANIVAAIGLATNSFTNIVTAADASPAVNLTAVVPGPTGNSVDISSSDASVVASGPTLTGGGSSFVLDPAEVVTAELRSQITNSEDGGGLDTGPAAAVVVLTDIENHRGGDSNPWNRSNLADPLVQPFNNKLVIDSALLYHPGRGGTARVVDEFMRVSIQNPSPEYLRQSPANLDTNFPGESGAPGDPVEIDFDPVHVQTWNRLTSLGLHAPTAPAYGGRVVANSEQDREHELFVDQGSKTLVFRPFQRKGMTLQAVTTGATPSLIGDTTYPNPALRVGAPTPGNPKDDAQIFTAGLQMAFPVPPEWMPRFGRQDIPYYQDNGPAFGGGQHLEGINHLFTDVTDQTNNVFYIIGGEDNQSAANLVTSMFIQTGPSSGFNYAEHGTIAGPGTPAYQGRLTSDIGNVTTLASEITERLNNVVSSDLGRGLKGIQMPPYLGVARIYGVYDRRDFVNIAGGTTYASDRVTPLANRAINLLKRDATQQTVFILRDGARDITGENGDHTYIIPFDNLDIERSPQYVAGEVPDDLEYVVECQVFGFSKGFIDSNNLVLSRRHTGTGLLVSDGDNPEIEDIPMTIPHAGPDSDRMYAAYLRTVYQGDPYMTRYGDVRTTSDYEHRYGEVSVTDAFELNTSIQQFDSDGNTIPQIPNARPLQVLASVDFYTTMGTGNMGGELFPGTVTDVGYTEDTPAAASRLPESTGDNQFRILTRAFSEGQRTNDIRAELDLKVVGNNATFNFGVDTVSIITLDGVLVEFTAVNGPTSNEDEFDASSADPATIARELHEAINARSVLRTTLVSVNDVDSPRLKLVSVPVGDEGNGIFVEVRGVENIQILVPKDRDTTLSGTVTGSFMRRGVDLPINAGTGDTQLRLTGMTERLPLGILIQDSNFIGENPLRDNASAIVTLAAGMRPVQSLLPLTRDGGEEYSRFLGEPGEFVSSQDGAILQYQAYTDATPGGTRRYRIFRGGGSSFVLSDPNPGGPVDWASGSLAPADDPVLKGGLLACKAMLVRNFHEEAFSTDDTTTHGDEIQMVVLTFGILGEGNTQRDGVNLNGEISPTGFGEGFAAADRYRLEGKPMYKGRVRNPTDPNDVEIALFPGNEEG